ncbi:nitrous oxide-stimulated promoter family protein [uncultured Thiodictyon sp.]|uniref:nitrous oxide-stimulated promoter family protein n=1 Tax=uncultured Thiodictyon sp. TaxID=1846217 RepID=UPI0025D82DC5|nr:nitrous oxide-stimulated promoter family protein [uncultured Thiodictyon sp.]
MAEGARSCCSSESILARVREVMRYAGPRMPLRHPWLALLHLIDREPLRIGLFLQNEQQRLAASAKRSAASSAAKKARAWSPTVMSRPFRARPNKQH